MMEEQNILADKRVAWKREIRRKDIQNLFTKKRKQFIINGFSEKQSFIDDYQQMEAITQIINLLPKESFVFIFRKIIEMDHSLTLLFSVTGLVPERVPPFYSTLIQQLIRNNKSIPQKIDFGQIELSRREIRSQQQNLQQIVCAFIMWQQLNGRHFQRVISLLNHLKNFNLAINGQIIEYFSLTVNICLILTWVVQRIKEIHGQIQTSTQKVQSYLNSCLLIMTNILAGEDQAIVPHLDIIMNTIGNHIRCIGLYFNLFLIKGVHTALRIELFCNLIRVLGLNTQQYMNDHKQITCILVNYFKNIDDTPQDIPSLFLDSGQKLVQLLSQLLKVLNLRYENTGIYLECFRINDQQQDLQFIYHLSIVLNQLGSCKQILRLVTESIPIRKFILNNLEFPTSKLHTKILINLLYLLSKATSDHYAFDCFFQEPRIIKKLLKMIGLWREEQFQEKQFLMFVNQLLFILSMACTHKVLFQQCLKSNIFQNINNLYFKMLKNLIVQSTRYQCKYLFLNLMIGAKIYLTEHFENSKEILQGTFGEKKTVYMFIEVLKEQKDRKFIQKAIELISFFCKLEENLKNCDNLSEFLDNPNILITLEDLQNTNLKKSEFAVRGMHILRRRKERIQSIEEMDI